MHNWMVAGVVKGIGSMYKGIYIILRVSKLKRERMAERNKLIDLGSWGLLVPQAQGS